LLLCVLALAVVGMHHLALAPHETAFHQAAPHQPISAMSVDSTAHTSGAAATVIEPGGPPTVQSADSPATGAGHDLMHLCLAILSAATWLVLVVLLSTAANNGGLATARLRVLAAHAWRRRRRAGRTLLTSVCVLRI
jgi:hypothetical protein